MKTLSMFELGAVTGGVVHRAPKDPWEVGLVVKVPLGKLNPPPKR